MRLVQFETLAGARAVGLVEGRRLRLLTGVASVRELALAAIQPGVPLADWIRSAPGDGFEIECSDFGAALRNGLEHSPSVTTPVRVL